MGTIAIACAAVDDVTGWCILAYIVVLIRTSQSAQSLGMRLPGLAVFLIVMIWGMRRLLTRIERRYARTASLSDDVLAMILLFLLVSSFSTEALGLTVLFGAFMSWAGMPQDPR